MRAMSTLKKCLAKLQVLMEQRNDMQFAFDEMMEDISSGARRFKVYRQMKMYNDASLNPVLYGTKGQLINFILNLK